MPNDLPTEPKYIAIRTAAEFLGVSIDTLRRWDKQGILKAQRPNGKDRVFLVKDLERFKYAHPLQVSEAADLLGMSISTLRRLETRGKLVPKRDSNGRRIYNFAELARFAKNVPSDKVAVTQSEVNILTKDAVAARIEVDTILRRVRRVRSIVASLAIFVVVSITTLTVLFLLYPSETADFFELTEPEYVSNGVILNRSVLGVANSNEASGITPIIISLFRPLAKVSLNLVGQIDEEKYQIATRSHIIDGDSLLRSISSIEISDSSDFIITDTSVIHNLNAELLDGRQVGSNPGNLVVIDDNGKINPDLIDYSTVEVAFTIEDRSIGGAQIELDTIENENIANSAITSNKIEDGTVSSSDLADNAVITAKIADNAITGAKIDNGTITTSDLSTGLSFSSSTLIDLSAVTHTSTTPQGLVLPNASSANPSGPSTGEGYLAWDTSGNQLIVYDGASWGTLAGTGDITGVTAGSGVTGGGASGGVTVNVGAGNGITVNADDIAINLATSGTTGGSSSNSGLEVGSGGLSLLKGCSDNQILKWTDAGGWACSNDTGSGSTVSVEEGDSSVTATLSTLDFLAADFIVQESPSGEANISVDYANSGITRVNQAQVVTGGWTFNTAATTFTTDLIANGGITLASGETISNGSDSTITLGRNDAGTVTLNAKDDDATAALTILPGGAAALTLGGSATTGITLVTDSTGDSEVVLPASSIGNSELVNSGLTFAGNSGSGSVALGGTFTIVGAGINNAVYSGGTVTITGTEADTLASVTGRGATSSTALTLSSTSNAITVGTLTISGDAFTDLTGTGLTISGGALNTTLGVAIDSSEITDATIGNGDIANDTIDLDKVSDTLTLDAATSITASGALGLTIGNNVTLSATGTGAIVATDLSCTDCITSTEISELTLGTDTAGNYVATVTGGAGLTGSGASEGSTPTLAVGAGNGITANADDIAVNLTSSGTTGSTSSNSGLEVGSGGLSLLKGCNDNEILKWTDAGGWACATDTSGSGSAAVQEGDSGVVASLSTLDFLAADFIVSESPSGEANISLDYANSGVTRVGQAETVTGGWTFNTAATTFTTAIDVNSASTVAGLTVDGNGSLSVSNGSLDGALSLSGTTSDNGLQIGLTNGTSGGTQNIAYFDNAASSGTTESILVIDNSDTDTAVTNAIEFINAGGGFTNLFNVAGTTISSGEFTLLDGRDTALVDTTDAVSTAITGTGTLTAGATGAGFTINFGTSTLSGNITGTNISGVDISDDTNLTVTNGITLTGDQLSLASTAAGDGLTYTTGVLAIGSGAGITVSADAIAATLGTSIANSEIDNDAIDFDKVSDTLTLDAATSITASGALGLTIGNNVTLSATGTGAITATDLSCTDCIGSAEVGELTLGTDTAGNYVATVTGGAGLTGSGSSEGSTPTIAVGAGNGIAVNADDIAVNLTSSGTTGSTSSNSGLEVGSGGLTLLKGCSDNELLKWTDAGGWACATDTSGSGAAAVQEGDSTIVASLSTLDFLAADFIVGESPSGEGNISIDYANSGITRVGQAETVTGGWTFNTASTTFTTAIDVNTASTMAGLTVDGNGNLSVSNGTIDGAISLSSTTSDNATQITLTNGTSSGTQNIAYFDNAASTGTTESIVVIDNSDSDTAVTNAIEFVNAGGGFTNLFNVAGTTISTTEFTLLDGRDTALVDTTDAVATAITGTGTLTAGATGAGFTINFGTSTLSGDVTSANISGVDISADTNLSASNGVTLTGDALSLSSAAGGDGLTYTTGVLAVGAGTGISVAADAISATLGTSIANAEIDDDVINFDKIANALTLDEGTTITAGGALGLTIGNNVTLSATGTGAITATDLSCADCINGTEIGDLTLGTDTAGNYVATITGGAGLTGSGSSEGSTPTLAVGAGNGITVNADDITIALTGSGTTGSTSSNSGLEVGSGGLSLLKGCTDTEILKWTDAGGWACAADETGGGGFTSFTAAGDSGGGQTISDGNSLSILGGTNGIDTVDSATDTVTLNLDTTEIGTTTFGSGSGITWTFNAGATDPVIAFGSDTIDFTAGTTTLSGNLTVSGGTILGVATSNLLNSVTTTLNFAGAATTLNIADGATTKTIDIGGVTADGTDTINIATNATSPDVISIGNGHGVSSIALTSGDSWAISANGVMTLSADSSQTTAIVATDTDYTNFASIGDNNIIGTTAAIDLTNFDVASTGALTLVGGLSPDITTQSNNNLTIQPGGTGAIIFNSSNTSASAIDINATGTVAGNAFTLDTTNGGIALTAGGASNGDITILSTDDLSINGTAGSVVNIGTSAVAQTIAIGASSNTDLALADAQWSITGAGVASFVSGTVLGSQTFTTNNIVDSGALTIKSATGANALTLDSGSTGTVNLGTSNNAKTINIGTGTQGNTILIGTDNTTSDTITIGTALDNVSIVGDSWSITDAGVLTVASCSGCGGGGGTLQQAYSGDADGSNAIILTDSTDGSVIIQTVAGTQFQVAATAAPTVDLASITNAGQGVTSTSGVDGLSITYVQATDAGAITGSGLDVTLTPSGDASDVIRGITLNNITSGSSTETGLYVGTGYDRDIEFADSTPTIRSADGAVLSFTDGTNTMASIKDQGTYAFLNITPKGTASDPATCAVGDVYVNSSDATIKACTGTDTWEALDGGGGGGTKVVTLHPEFPGATLTANGSATINGTMTSDVTGSADGWKNFYEWNSSQTSLQDYTVAVRFKLPSDFSSWATSNAIVVNYVTESTANTNNKIDIDIRNEDDTPGTTVTTSSANVSGVAATWTSVAIDDSVIDDGAAPDIDAAGEDIVLLIKLYSKDSNYSRVGDIVLTYTAQ